MTSWRVRLNWLVVVTLLLLVAWQVVAAVGRTGTSAWPIALLGGVLAALVLGGFAGRRAPFLFPALVCSGLLLVLLLNPDSLDGSPLAGPLGYANADAALAVQGVAAAGLALLGGRGWLRVFPLVAAVGLLVVTPLIRSVAADVVLVPVAAVVAVAALRTTMPTGAIAACTGVLVAGCVAATIALGATYHRGTESAAGALAERTLTVTRVALWRDALHLTFEHPLRGVGPRRFPATSPVARRDRDTRQAHSDFLQAAAEGGVPAFALVITLVAAVLARLGVEHTPAAAVGAVAVGAVAVQGAVDYVLQFPGLLLVAAALAGSAAAPSGRAPGNSGLMPRSP